MKENKGITLTSLIIYIIVLTTVIGTIAMITKHFKTNVSKTITSNNVSEQYARFTTYITSNLNSQKFQKVKIDNGVLNVFFNDNTINQYIYSNNEIYYQVTSNNIVSKKITLCTKVTSCKFSYENNVLKTNVVMNDRVFNNSYNVK